VTLPLPALPSPAVPTELSPDLRLAAIEGEARTLQQWLTLFHLASVVVDPYANESSWILDTARRLMHHYDDAAVRVSWIVTGDADAAQAFLGPLSREFLTFTDETGAFAKAAGIERLPAFVFVRMDGSVQGLAQGWDPAEWEKVCDVISTTVKWSRPTLPQTGDPMPYHGAPVSA
jgi:hypothetical protein